MRSDAKTRVLFLCTGNSCRSQMAEGFCRELGGDAIEPRSAGVTKGVLDPRAVRVMSEAGVDISGQRSKTTEELPEMVFDYVVTLCDHARESCPFFPAGTRLLHEGFEDPPLLAAAAADEEEALGHYRRVRDRIREYVLTLPGMPPSDDGACGIPEGGQTTDQATGPAKGGEPLSGR